MKEHKYIQVEVDVEVVPKAWYMDYVNDTENRLYAMAERVQAMEDQLAKLAPKPTIPLEALQEVLELVRNNQKITAIKTLRNWTPGLSLLDAKKFVDTLR
jgi:ribosomal protein L7/L12